jgi:hypothetical protein
MGERPADTTLDRKENSKGYTPSNCRWATKSEQMFNRRTRNRIRIDRQKVADMLGLAIDDIMRPDFRLPAVVEDINDRNRFPLRTKP